MRDIKFISKKEDRINFLGKAESLINDCRIEMFSNREITVDGCMGVLDFNDAYVKLKLKKGNAIIYGSGLLINGFEDSSITIRGNLSSIEFCIGEAPRNV